MAFLLLAGIAMSLQAQEQVDEYDEDLGLGIPRPMWVGDVDAKAGLIELDGRMYRIGQGKAIEMAAGPGKRLELADLEPGMQVLVSTDGTEPGRGRMPFVLGIWRIE
jgi:hypothetical protein